MSPEFIVGRPVLNSVSTHPHVEFLIRWKHEAVLEHPWRTLAEIVHNMSCMSKPEELKVVKPFNIEQLV